MLLGWIVWRRLDLEGHDVCRLFTRPSGVVLDGTTVFAEPGGGARLDYRVEADQEFRTRRALIRGWVGDRAVAQRVARAADGEWTLDGERCAGCSGCDDLDLGFTPATNLLQLRRIALAVGGAADVPVAWLDAGATRLERLAQRYERREDTAYWYESPTFDYRALLEVSALGFVRRYPGLWEAVADSQSSADIAAR